MSVFSEKWDREVKQLAQNCVTDPKLIQLMGKGENYMPTEAEKTYFEEAIKKYKDPYGMFYISNMIWEVEHALADGKEDLAKLAIEGVFSTLNSESYFKNVFKEDTSSDEYKTRVILRDGLRKLLD